MESVLEIEAAIERLPKEDAYQLVARLEKRWSDAWDQQFESEVNSGRLDSIARAAIAEHRSGKSKAFPEDAE